jgi:ATP-dependent protease ClpP protease subunit
MSKRKYSELSELSEYDMINTNKPDYEITLFDRLNPMIYSINNEFHFKSDVNKLNIELLIRQMSEYITKYYSKHESKKELIIKYVVDTPGGELNQAFKFIDFVDLIRKKYKSVKFYSIITGMVASAGTLMCVIADKRMMTKYSSAMIHELTTGCYGKYTHLNSYNVHMNDLHEKLVDVYQTKNGKISKEYLESLLKDESWFNAKQYLEIGFIDEIC